MSHLVTLLSNKPPIFADYFDRQDSTTTLGAAYTSDFGTWGVSSGQAYCVSDVAGALVWRNAASNFNLTCKVSGSYGSTNRSLPLAVFHRIDANNFLTVGSNSANNVVEIQKRDTGTFSSLATSTAFAWVDGQTYNLSVVCSGNQISVYVDGVLRISHTLTGGNTKYAVGTGVGLRLDKAGTPTTPARWDELIANPL